MIRTEGKVKYSFSPVAGWFRFLFISRDLGRFTSEAKFMYVENARDGRKILEAWNARTATHKYLPA
jgi:hypothetical protein